MIVFVDLGYLLFYRYHATLRWLEFQKDLPSPPTTETLKDYFQKHLISQLDKWKKKYRSASFFFCADERHDCVWRLAIYPEYKGNRGTFVPILRELYDIVMSTIPAYGTVLATPCLEADDVVYLSLKHIRSLEHRKTETVVIITSDRDYLQMVDEHVEIIDATGKAVQGCGDAAIDLITKILKGDTSDNIPAVCKGCGKKTAEALARDPVKLHEFITKKACQEEYDRNKQLICMDMIPEHLIASYFLHNIDKLPQ